MQHLKSMNNMQKERSDKHVSKQSRVEKSWQKRVA
jgi:hypothetical protein